MVTGIQFGFVGIVSIFVFVNYAMMGKINKCDKNVYFFVYFSVYKILHNLFINQFMIF